MEKNESVNSDWTEEMQFFTYVIDFLLDHPFAKLKIPEKETFTLSKHGFHSSNLGIPLIESYLTKVHCFTELLKIKNLKNHFPKTIIFLENEKFEPTTLIPQKFKQYDTRTDFFEEIMYTGFIHFDYRINGDFTKYEKLYDHNFFDIIMSVTQSELREFIKVLVADIENYKRKNSKPIPICMPYKTELSRRCLSLT